MRRCADIALLLLFMAGVTGADTPAGDTPSRVYGWVEKAMVMPVGALVKIKLDTGALTSSIHAENIRTYDIEDDGHGVRFDLELEDQRSGEIVSREMDLPVERYLIVRGAGGEEQRPVVKLSLCIGERVYEEQFSLRNRDDMLYPVLIGRRTLRDMGLVDSSDTFLSTPRCPLPQ